MNRINQLREQLDACRPGSGDLDLPELADLARTADADRAVAEELARSQRFDGAVGAAMHDVPVPAGLLDRLLAATSAAAATVENPVTLPPANINATRKRGILSRRNAIFAGLVTAALALLALGPWLAPPGQPETVTKVQLEGELTKWLGLVSAPEGWATKTPPVAFTFDPDVLAKAVRWRKLTTSRREAMVEYDCDPDGLRRVTLFVVSTSAKYTVPDVPSVRLTTTGGVVASAWQRGKLLYVLVVPENGPPPEHYIRKRDQA